MKRLLKAFGILVLVLVGLIGAGAAYVAIDGIPRYSAEKVDLNPEPTPERQARGKKLATLLCAGCHMDPATRKLTGKAMIDVPHEFGTIYSKNITQHAVKGIGAWTPGEIAYLLRTGVDRRGQYLPPWMVKLPHLSDEDIASILVFLRSDDPLVAAADVDPPGVTKVTFLSKLLAHVAFKKIPYPDHPIATPPITDKVAYGRYLVVGLDCYPCHSADFKTMNVAEPEKSGGYLGGGNELPDLNGTTLFSANITPDPETGLGKWTEADFARALREGFRPNGHVLRYPMVPLPELSNEDVSAMYAYLQSVPPLRHAVDRKEDANRLPANTDEGKRVYYKYGCVSCHGETGVGIADLRNAREHFPEAGQLRAWIQNAPQIKPGTKMPRWKGIIAEAEYEPLIGYVLELGRKKTP